MMASFRPHLTGKLAATRMQILAAYPTIGPRLCSLANRYGNGGERPSPLQDSIGNGELCQTGEVSRRSEPGLN